MLRKLSPLLVGCAALASLWLVLPSIGAEPKDKGSMDSAAQNFGIEHEIGPRFHIDPKDLPAPKTGPIVTNRVLIVPFGEQTLAVPKGFTATPFAVGLVTPRRLLVLPNGDVLVAEQSAGYLTLLRDAGDGHAKWIHRRVADLK